MKVGFHNVDYRRDCQINHQDFLSLDQLANIMCIPFLIDSVIKKSIVTNTGLWRLDYSSSVLMLTLPGLFLILFSRFLFSVFGLLRSYQRSYFLSQTTQFVDDRNVFKFCFNTLLFRKHNQPWQHSRQRVSLII